MKVGAVVVLPGWMVIRKGKSDVAVLSGKELASYMRGQADGKLDERGVRAVAARLDDACRDVEGG